MKRFILSFVLFSTVIASAQNSVNDTIVLTRVDAETIFLQSNLSLLAEKLNIDIAEAQVIQAKVWPNPTLSVSEVNLWSNSTSEELPVLWGNYGRNQEIGLSLEQLVYTAGKRKKLIAIEKVGVQMAAQYYKDILRSLKTEFRNNLTALQFNQQQKSVYEKQLLSVRKLISAYSSQVKQGNISQAEYVRLKASELEFLNELNELNIEGNALQKEMKILMNLPARSYIKLENEGFVPNLNSVNELNLADIINEAENNRPDLQFAKLAQQYSDNKYTYEKALRTPDITLQASYDRGGNIMNNFFGVGFAIDLPFFNRNQGNIKAAKHAIEQSNLIKEQTFNSAQAEIVQAYSNFTNARQLYESIDNGYDKDLDMILESHLKNFSDRNISLLVYLDYVEAYIKNKEIILTSKKQLNERLEELRYTSGQELN
ncbi:TolC family protein [Flavobacterium rakeshii]|uniref:TolC family protein n=1 Tax=Flavobacterium rakeshii TaxID=1038845 RepID=A0A6N8HA65_9FLAO|nr:TolC family protein [Flavobacterium rakeshii]MUV03331.1 TolC family protein [Flavobacterium rakeshii]